MLLRMKSSMTLKTDVVLSDNEVVRTTVQTIRALEDLRRTSDVGLETITDTRDAVSVRGCCVQKEGSRRCCSSAAIADITRMIDADKTVLKNRHSRLGLAGVEREQSNRSAGALLGVRAEYRRYGRVMRLCLCIYSSATWWTAGRMQGMGHTSTRKMVYVICSGTQRSRVLPPPRRTPLRPTLLHYDGLSFARWWTSYPRVHLTAHDSYLLIYLLTYLLTTCGAMVFTEICRTLSDCAFSSSPKMSVSRIAPSGGGGCSYGSWTK